MNKTENKTEGLTLYTLQSNYSGDTTKNCGLTGGEIDANFLFLRGNDIYSGEIDEENNTLILKRGNENIITIPNIRKNTQITGGYINNVTGELVLETNFDNIIITGFTSSSFFTDITIHGDGSTNNPIRLSELYKSPYLPSVKTVVDLTNNEVIQEKYKTTGTYIITKEYDNSNGLLYNFNGIKEIESKLKEDNSNWRVPTFEDWGQMLNALEICEDRNHLTFKNGYFGKFAGAYLKNDGLGWIEKTETSYSYGFKANSCGFKTSKNDTDSNYGLKTRFWTSDINEYEEIWVKELDKNESRVKTSAGDKEGFYSLRLVRDYENVDLVNEKILENNYDIIKMPYVIIDTENNVTQSGYRVWTSVNINFSEINKENYTEVNNNIETKTHLFYLNYWNGNNWVKRLIEENDVVTVEDRDNREYKLINGNLQKLSSNEFKPTDYYTKNEIDYTYAKLVDLEEKEDKIYDLTNIRNNSNKGATAVQPENLCTINNISLLKKGNINLNETYYTKKETNELIDGIVADDIDLTNYYTKSEIINLIEKATGETISLTNEKINELNSEIEYLKKIISRVLDISLKNENNENLNDNEISKLGIVIKEIEPDKGNEIIVKREGTAVYIDINPESLGELTEIN